MQNPLDIYILWHPSFKKGEGIAADLYAIFNRNVQEPFVSKIGIPVYYRSVLNSSGVLKKIGKSRAIKSVVIVLLDIHFVKDAIYLDYLKDLFANQGIRVLPVAFSSSVFNHDPTIASHNLFRYYDFDLEVRGKALTFTLLHEVARCLYGLNTATKAATGGSRETPPARIFISHAKDRSREDGGERIAKHIKAFINSETGLNTFFDANHLSIGGKFKEEIEDAIKESTLLAIHSDIYSSRPWCQKEVLWAKEHNRPIVVVNAFKGGEIRSFPYMNNVLALHWNTISLEELESAMYELMIKIMRETLRHKFFSEKMKMVSEVQSGKYTCLAYPPELLTIKDLRNETIVYPDPPLGTDEINILESLGLGNTFLTSSQL